MGLLSISPHLLGVHDGDDQLHRWRWDIEERGPFLLEEEPRDIEALAILGQDHVFGIIWAFLPLQALQEGRLIDLYIFDDLLILYVYK